MAHLEFISFGGDVQIGVNISKTVGSRATNLREDVALIQALFNYIADGSGPETLGFFGVGKIPAVSGIFDHDTIIAIQRFQMWNASRLLIGDNYDGRIHPASYKGRVLKNPRKPLMAITLLHVLARVSAFKQGHPDYISQLRKPHWISGVTLKLTLRG